MYMHTSQRKARGHLSPSAWLRLTMNWFWRVQSHAAQLCLASCTARYPACFGKTMSIYGQLACDFWNMGCGDPMAQASTHPQRSWFHDPFTNIFEDHAVPGRISQQVIIIVTVFLRQMSDRVAERDGMTSCQSSAWCFPFHTLGVTTRIVFVYIQSYWTHCQVLCCQDPSWISSPSWVCTDHPRLPYPHGTCSGGRWPTS